MTWVMSGRIIHEYMTRSDITELRSAESAWTFHILKALVVKNSVLHDFGFGKVSPAKQL